MWRWRRNRVVPEAEPTEATDDVPLIFDAKCGECGRTARFARSDLQGIVVARRHGWLIWSGESIGGTALSVTVCPDCRKSQVEPDPDGPVVPSGWNAICSTCGYDMWEDWERDAPRGGFTESDARTWKWEHECEPDVGMVPPDVAERIAS